MSALKKIAGESPAARASALANRLLGAPAAMLLAVALCAIVNLLSARHYRRFDWTRAQLFTLSPRSQQVARAVRSPIELVVLLGRGEPQWRESTELTERYRALNPLIAVRAIDPDRQSAQFVAFAQRYGIRLTRSSQSEVGSEAAIVVVRNDRHLEIKRDQLAALGEALREGGAEASAAERIANARITVERAVSSAIVQVEHSDRPTVCVSKGHDELPLQGTDESMQMLAQELEHDNVTVRETELRGTATVPSDCDVLMIGGPRQAFSAGESQIILRYLRSGGNLLLLLDPFFVDAHHAPTGLEEVTRAAGIEPARVVVVESDPQQLLEGVPPMIFTASDFGVHELSRNFRGIDAHVLVRTARALRVTSGASVVPEALLRSSAQSWGESGELEAVRDGTLRMDADDIRGPIDLALASHVEGAVVRPGRAANGRVVVIGFSYLVTNEAMGLSFRARYANAAFVQAAVGWLVARSDLQGIAPRPASSAALLISQESLRMIWWYALLFVPGAAAIVGFAVLRARKARD
jgi:hypothetical protein